MLSLFEESPGARPPSSLVSVHNNFVMPDCYFRKRDEKNRSLLRFTGSYRYQRRRARRFQPE